MPEIRPQTSETKSANEPKHQGWWGRTRASFQSHMPQWVRDNSSRINQLGLMAGTMVIMGSVWRGRAISRDIWKAQEKILGENGFQGAALAEKTAELVQSGVMKLPTLHRQRMFYLPTAIGGLAVGGFIKDKETPQERESYKGMSWPSYLGMRLKQSLDPMHHSRQTAGVLGAASGVLAIISGLSQPGGALKSEVVVGATLISGFTGLTFINDPAKAKQALNICWATRLPVVVTGTYETLMTHPTYKHPLTPGGALLKLPYKRMDVSYPIGQWFNMAMATFGFLMAGSDEKKKAAEQAATPSPQVSHTQGVSRLAENPDRALAKA